MPRPPRHSRARAVEPLVGRRTDTHRRLHRGLRGWHQRVGLTAFAFLIWLAVTGMFLARSADLGLDGYRIRWPWLMALYGLAAEPPQSGYVSGVHWLASTHDYTLLDGKPLTPPVRDPRGLVAATGAEGNADAAGASAAGLFIAGPRSLVLVSTAGARVDELQSPVLPLGAIRRVGTLGDAIVIQDLDAWSSTDAGETWTALPAAELGQVRWSQLVALTTEQRERLRPYARPSVTAEQVLVDLHSGQLFGAFGSWIVTAVGALALWLASSGFWMWFGVRRRRRLGQR